MPLIPGPAWLCTAGLMAGSTLVYLLTVMLGQLLPSWPLNGFFTPLAVVSLVLQAPYVRRPAGPYTLGAVLGGAALLLYWLFYCYGWPT
ncbi:hypothetical protein [Pseudomonas sp. ML96]|uniref:hypothetical protein n=1 Tax=Pseudomonas sp. ML96 TaxID=1523503 RepID=UPI0005B8380F|nr:hypothetical protein [Pseudomonas sp. ML96]